MPPDLLPTLLSFLSEYVRRQVADAVGEALARELPRALQAASRPTYMSREEAASYVSRSLRSLDGLRISGRLPWTKRGGRVLLRTDDLDAYLEAGRVPAKLVGKADGTR